MIKPKRLQRGDAVALVSLSSGMGGEKLFRHRYELGKERLERQLGLRVSTMPHALRGIDYLDRYPEARAADLMQAFADPEIKAVIPMIGGDDTIRLLPFIDYAILQRNPKIFLGYSDTTINHFMLRQAGLVSFYGPCLLCEFAENGAMHDYTLQYLQQVLFEATTPLPILPSPRWTSEFLDWADAENNATARNMQTDTHGYTLLQGRGKVSGRLIGGCVDVLPMLIGTELWPTAAEWQGGILFLETSKEHPHPNIVKYLLRGLAAQGIIDRICGIAVGKPKDETWYEEYQDVFRKVIGQECGRPDLPVLYNLNFGHTAPICTLPYGILAEIDCEQRSFSLLEAAVI